jgi:hypothetical protein
VTPSSRGAWLARAARRHGAQSNFRTEVGLARINRQSHRPPACARVPACTQRRATLRFSAAGRFETPAQALIKHNAIFGELSAALR